MSNSRYRDLCISLNLEDECFASRMYRARPRHPLQSAQFSQSNNQIRTSINQIPNQQNVENQHSGSIAV